MGPCLINHRVFLQETVKLVYSPRRKTTATSRPTFL
jgi:hypothetical protein